MTARDRIRLIGQSLKNQEPPLTRGFLIDHPYSISHVPPAQASSFLISVSSWSS